MAGYKLANGEHEELTELQWRAIPHMVVLVASLKNGTYKDEYLNGGTDGIDNATMSVEDLTAVMLKKKPLGKSSEEVSKRYYTEKPANASRWKQIKEIYK